MRTQIVCNVLLAVSSVCMGIGIGLSARPDHTDLLKEVAHTVLMPIYADREMTEELPLSHRYTEYEIDLWERVVEASDYSK